MKKHVSDEVLDLKITWRRIVALMDLWEEQRAPDAAARAIRDQILADLRLDLEYTEQRLKELSTPVPDRALQRKKPGPVRRWAMQEIAGRFAG